MMPYILDFVATGEKPIASLKHLFSLKLTNRAMQNAVEELCHESSFFDRIATQIVTGNEQHGEILTRAIRHNQNLAKALINANVDVKAYNNAKLENALISAANLGDLEIIDMLIKKAAHCDIESSMRALFYAMRRHHKIIVEKLLAQRDSEACCQPNQSFTVISGHF